MLECSRGAPVLHTSKVYLLSQIEQGWDNSVDRRDVAALSKWWQHYPSLNSKGDDIQIITVKKNCQFS